LENKLDLAQAEAVADLINAASREAVRSAQRSLSGEFSEAVRALVSLLTELRALTEATLDFPEEDIEAMHRDNAAARLARIRLETAQLLARSRLGNLLSSGIRVVIAGRPNVGKSSLLNRLAGEERAIVTAVAGTTRDALREPIEIHGVPVVLVDTAGLRESSDEVERLGIARTHRELEHADVVLAISEAGAKHEALEKVVVGAARIDVFNKVDLVPAFEAPAGLYPTVLVSARTGVGLDALRGAILKAAGWSSSGESVFLARERHLRALERATIHLEAAEHESGRWEFFAEELRLAQLALSEITGEVTADDLLGEIFSRFCIGK
ncbi:MAG TPA: tRNA modification GTPase, partial [Burkholderiales bacterium]|nr:tRNA modification GTPase [Burkholderiales bacterium]